MKPLKSLLNSLLLATALITSSVGGASADWNNAQGEDGKGCYAAAKFENGGYLMFIAWGDGDITLTFAKDGVHFTAKKPYRAILETDKTGEGAAHFRGLNDGSGIMTFLTKDGLHALTSANWVSITVGGHFLGKLSLAGSSAAVSKALECASHLGDIYL